MHPMSWHEREAMEVAEMEAAIENTSRRTLFSALCVEAMKVVEMQAATETEMVQAGGDGGGRAEQSLTFTVFIF